MSLRQSWWLMAATSRCNDLRCNNQPWLQVNSTWLNNAVGRTVQDDTLKRLQAKTRRRGLCGAVDLEMSNAGCD